MEKGDRRIMSLFVIKFLSQDKEKFKSSTASCVLPGYHNSECLAGATAATSTVSSTLRVRINIFIIVYLFIYDLCNDAVK
jgi:hypothetical protein